MKPLKKKEKEYTTNKQALINQMNDALTFNFLNRNFTDFVELKKKQVGELNSYSKENIESLKKITQDFNDELTKAQENCQKIEEVKDN